MTAQRGLGILIVIFLVLVVVIISRNGGVSPEENVGIFLGASDETGGDEVENAPIVIPTSAFNRVFDGWTGDDVEAMRFEDPFNDDQLTLLRDEEGRWVSLELSSDVDQNIAQALAATLAILPYRDAIEGVPAENYGDFGLTLDGVLMLVSIVLENGDIHVVAIGLRTPDGGSHYILVNEREVIYTSPAEPIGFLLTYPAEAIDLGN